MNATCVQGLGIPAILLGQPMIGEFNKSDSKIKGIFLSVMLLPRKEVCRERIRRFYATCEFYAHKI